MPGQLRPAAGIERRQGLGLHRGQLLGERVHVQDGAFQLVQGPFRRVHPQQLVDLAGQPVQRRIRIVTPVMVMTASPHFER